MRIQKIRKILIAIAASAPLVIAAEAKYRLSAPIPGLEKIEGTSPFTQYLQYMIPFLLGATAILAVVLITIGGVQYVISGGNESHRSDAKSRIWHAIGGLVLAAVSWIILNTINPDLVTMKLPLQKVEIKMGSSIFNKYPNSCGRYKTCLEQTKTNFVNPDTSCLDLREQCNTAAITNHDCIGTGTKRSDLLRREQCSSTRECATGYFCGRSNFTITTGERPYECALPAEIVGGNNNEKNRNIICP